MQIWYHSHKNHNASLLLLLQPFEGEPSLNTALFGGLGGFKWCGCLVSECEAASHRGWMWAAAITMNNRCVLWTESSDWGELEENNLLLTEWVPRVWKQHRGNTKQQPGGFGLPNVLLKCARSNTFGIQLWIFHGASQLGQQWSAVG